MKKLNASVMLPAVASLFLIANVAVAATTNIAQSPIFATTAAAVEVKPNILLTVDDSGSMSWDYMPDIASNFQGRVGGASSQCNGVYYNPKTEYLPPVDSAGVSYPNSDFYNASTDGYNTTASRVNLSISFQSYGNDTAQAAYYYVYKGSQNTEYLKNFYDSNSNFYKECISKVGTTLATTNFTKVSATLLLGTSGTLVKNGLPVLDERTNFANWFTYYRTRILMMKTSTGQAFKSLNSHFRVGLMTLNNNTGSSFLNISDFDSTQAATFYSKLYAISPNNSTPLREALANAGRIFAGKITSLNGSSVKDPVQYSCQQNYTILSTDGFWNGTDSDVKKLDGVTVMGNEDGGYPRPYNDGSKITSQTIIPYTSTQTVQTTTNYGTYQNTYTRVETVIGNSCSVSSGAPANQTTFPLNAGNSGYNAGLGVSNTNPDSGRCYSVGNKVWFCRGNNSGNNPVSTAQNSTATDSNGTTWYLVSSGANGGSGCISSNTAFGGNYSNNRGICPSTSVAGKLVTVTPYTRTETVTSGQNVSVDLYTAQQTTTQTTVNGVAGSVGALTPDPATFTFTSNVSSVNTNAGSNFGPWTAGTPTTNNQCVATGLLPTAGTSAESLTSQPAQPTGVVVGNPVVLTSKVAGTPVVTTVGSGGVSNTLADVASYYYNTNLRTSGLNNCTGPTISPSTTPNNLCIPNSVPPNGIDTATWQHMTTFTLGLGTRGRMVFSPTYLQDALNANAKSDYVDVAKGNTALKTNTTCTWRDVLTVEGAACNWPVPGADQIENIDDLWHAAVNGHGNYFAATDPASLSAGLQGALNVIINTPTPGTASAAATTNPRITSTNNFQFSSYFKTVEWSGELIRQTMNLVDGSVPNFNPLSPDPKTYDWSAQTLLDAKTYTDRNIFTKGSSGKVPFTWAGLTAAGLSSNFTVPRITTSPPTFPSPMTGISQFCSSGSTCISSTAQVINSAALGGAGGEALVNFLRGDRSNEEGAVTDPSKFYRHRTHVLGDIVSAQPQYVGPPSRSFTDTNYDAFKTLWKDRKPLIFAAANDGMLHAFDAGDAATGGGSEKWAYIPSFVLPRLYTLADKNYANLHQYFVEGTPSYADICPKAPTGTCAANEWKTIMVGGLNGGGTGYYAVDVTDPANPDVLWEFTDDNMGYTFGKPQITKLSDGTWVVIVTSGYNNCPYANTTAQRGCVKNGTGNGQGYVYVLNAGTGLQISSSPISTPVGTSASPSGLAQVIAQADANGVTQRVYGGDLLGNLWRFSVGPASVSPKLLATLKDGLGNIQPITARPQVSTINGNPVVFVGTGQYLGTTDVGSTLGQSFYAVKDILGASTGAGNPRANSNFIGNLATATTCPQGTDISICQPGQLIRTVTQVAGKSTDTLSTKDGWYLDFPAGSGELEFTDPKLVLGTLSFSTSVPKASTATVCSPKNTGSDGDALGYMLDYSKGGAVGTSSGVIAVTLGVGIATAPQIAQLPSSVVVAKFRLSTGQEVTQQLRVVTGGSPTKRISWRELITQ